MKTPYSKYRTYVRKDGETGIYNTVSILPGSNVTLDQSGNSITINSTGGSGSGTLQGLINYDYIFRKEDNTIYAYDSNASIAASGTNATTVFNSVSDNNKRYFFDTGSYTISANCTLQNNILIDGSGVNSTTLTAIPDITWAGGIFYGTSKNNIEIKNITFNGNVTTTDTIVVSSTYGNLLRFASCNNIKIHDCNFFNPRVYAIYMEFATTVDIGNCVVKHCGWDGIDAFKSTFGVVHDCLIEDCNEEGINMAGGYD